MLPSAVSLCTNSFLMALAASLSKPSFVVAPWSTGAIFRPSSSQSLPPVSTKATKWRSTASSSPGGRVSPLLAAGEGLEEWGFGRVGFLQREEKESEFFLVFFRRRKTALSLSAAATPCVQSTTTRIISER